MRVVLGVEYNGTNFCGWQSQPAMCGVQDALEAAIKSIALHNIRIHAAGRTDTGVHAMMQVVHFDAEVNRPISAWVRGVNAYLPASVRVLWAKVMPTMADEDTFHARFSATQRHYQYLLINTPIAPAIMACNAGWYHVPLELTAMQEAASYLLGEHDFSAFRASDCQAKSPIRTMLVANVHRTGNHITFNFSANAFLQHQVRNMVGALIYIGNGKHPPSFIKHLLAQQNRTLSPPTFSPNGLYLTGVSYHEKWGLPTTQRPIGYI